MAGVIPTEYAGVLTSDASGSWGCGAFTASGEWFQLRLPESWDAVHITAKPMIVLGGGSSDRAGQSTAGVTTLQ